MNVRTWIGAAGLMGLIAAASFAAASLGGGAERLVVVFLINLVAVLGISMYSGNSGILSFGHLAFMGLGAYTSGILTLPLAMKKMTLPRLPAFLANTHVDFITSIVITVIVVMAIAYVVGLVLYKLEGSAATIATLALLVIVHGVIIGARDITRGSQSFFGVPRETDIVVAAVVAIIAIAAARLFRDSVPGLKLRAARDDAPAAGSMGVNVRRHNLLAMVVSAGVVALAGVLLGHYLGAFSAKKFFFVDTFMLLAMLIVGGMSTVSGALAGAVLITLVTEAMRHLEGGVTILGVQLPQMFGMTQIGIGLIILLVMFKKSEGLLDKREWDEMLFPESSAPGGGKGKAVFAEAQKGEPVTLRAKNITKSFDGLLALSDVSITIADNEIMGLIGPNGSGKTTLLNVLSGALSTTSGGVLINGRDMAGSPAHVMAGHGVGRTFQNIRLFSSLTVRQNVLIPALRRWPRVGRSQAIAAAQAAIAAMRLEDKAGVFASTLSYGEQRRVEIARALALRPRFLFLDEPAAGMNREETDELMEDLRHLKEAHSMGILIIDHDLPLIMRLCDRVVVLNEGKVIAKGTPGEVQRHPAVIEAYLGRKAREKQAGELQSQITKQSTREEERT